ncbi:MAG: FliO/MopB family protein, partial [Oligoflexia bacterium]|nr:FliO/MopB family protein [Oligoflexia bacterium]
MAYQYEKDVVRARVILPFKIQDFQNEIKVLTYDNKIEILFPLNDYSIKNKSKNIPATASTNSVTSTLTKTNNLNEEYFQKLLKEDHEKNNNNNSVNKNDNTFHFAVDGEKEKEKEKDKEKENKNDDSVNIKLSANEKNKIKNDTFNLINNNNNNNSNNNNSNKRFDFSNQNLYIVKFIFFMLLVLGLFYVLVYFFKKTVLGRGKLGFLKDTAIVTVLSNNYIAPKRSLITVKVHNQIFLLSNSEQGIHFLSEINDTTGLIKKSEQYITGTNFDSNVSNAEKDALLNKKVKLKNVDTAMMEDMDIEELDNNINVNSIKTNKDRISFSDQLKKKI